MSLFNIYCLFTKRKECSNINGARQDFFSKEVKRLNVFMCFVRQVEKQRAELNRELEELGERLDEAGGATQAQVGVFEHFSQWLFQSVNGETFD